MAKRGVRIGAGAALAALVMACGGKPAGPSTAGGGATGAGAAAAAAAASDALFALAPAGSKAAVVVSGRGLELLDATLARTRAIGRADPFLGELTARAEQGFTDELGVARGARLAALGLRSDRGFAYFKLGDDRSVWIWPVTDRVAFTSAFRGRVGADGVDTVEVGGNALRCREVKGVYACAGDVALLERLGTGSLAGKVETAGARGEVEVVAVTGDDLAPGTTYTTAIVIELEPGQAVVRARIAGDLGRDLRELVGAPVRVDAGRAAGFLAAALPRSMTQTGLAGPLGDAVRALRGPFTAVAPSGAGDIDVTIPLTDATPVRALVARCDLLPLPPTLAVRVDGDRCRISSRQPPLFSAIAWLDGNTLRINRSGGAPAAATGPAMTATGRELATAAWTLVAWGRGSAEPGPGGLGLTALPGGDDAAIGMRVLGYVRELGLGVRFDEDALAFTLVVRTALANPPAVADALPGLIARAAEGADISADLAALARANPGSPLADDLAAGPTGLMLPAMALGVVSAVAIPKFLDYMKVSKRSEAEVNLDAIRKGAEAEAMENESFPVATAPLTPARPCCEGRGRRCPAVEKDWVGVAAWDALGFELVEPSFFQYSYTSDGRTLRATAVGDLDCDGVTVTYELRGTLDGTGRPRWQLVRPSRAD